MPRQWHLYSSCPARRRALSVERRYGPFAQTFVRDQLVVPGDAAVTATNIVEHASLFRLGIAADVFTFVSAVVLTVILYAR